MLDTKSNITLKNSNSIKMDKMVSIHGFSLKTKIVVKEVTKRNFIKNIKIPIKINLNPILNYNTNKSIENLKI